MVNTYFSNLGITTSNRDRNCQCILGVQLEDPSNPLITLLIGISEAKSLSSSIDVSTTEVENPSSREPRTTIDEKSEVYSKIWELIIGPGVGLLKSELVVKTIAVQMNGW